LGLCFALALALFLALATALAVSTVRLFDSILALLAQLKDILGVADLILNCHVSKQIYFSDQANAVGNLSHPRTSFNQRTVQLPAESTCIPPSPPSINLGSKRSRSVANTVDTGTASPLAWRSNRQLDKGNFIPLKFSLLSLVLLWPRLAEQNRSVWPADR
jgi:hypothetical protein